MSSAAGHLGSDEMPCRPRCCPTARSRAPPPPNEGIRVRVLEALGSLAGVFGVVLVLKITECKHPAGK